MSDKEIETIGDFAEISNLNRVLPAAMSDSLLTLYTTSLCPDCWRVKAVLRKLGAPFQEIDILTDQDGGEEMVRRSGQRHVPTLIFPDGSILVEPDNLTLLERMAPLIDGII